MYNEVCIGECLSCGRQIKCNYTHRNQKLYCTTCNKQVEYIIAKDVKFVYYR
jgi:hypothetical protein